MFRRSLTSSHRGAPGMYTQGLSLVTLSKTLVAPWERHQLFENFFSSAASVADVPEFIAVAETLALKLPTLSDHYGFELAPVVAVWSRALTRTVSGGEDAQGEESATAAAGSAGDSNRGLKKAAAGKGKGNEDKKKKTSHAAAKATTSGKKVTLSAAFSSPDIMGRVMFLWKECGCPALSPINVLAITQHVVASDSSSNKTPQQQVTLLHLQSCLQLLASTRHRTADAGIDARYEAVKQMLCSRLNALPAFCSNVAGSSHPQQQQKSSSASSSSTSATQQANCELLEQQHRQRKEQQQALLCGQVMDCVAVGAHMAKEGHHLPPRDREMILDEVEHVLASCVSSDGRCCFTVESLTGGSIGGKINNSTANSSSSASAANTNYSNSSSSGTPSLLSFCLEMVTMVDEATWSERTISLIFSWVTAARREMTREFEQQVGSLIGSNSNSTRQQRESLQRAEAQLIVQGDRLIRFALLAAVKHGIPLSFLINSPAIKELSFVGLVHSVSLASLRPLAAMLPASILRDLFATHFGSSIAGVSSSSSSASVSALVSILPLVTLHLPQIAPDVAGAIARQSDIATVPSILIRISANFKELSSSSSAAGGSGNNKSKDSAAAASTWVETNAEIRERVSSVLLADLVDPSMTTQSVQLLNSNADQLAEFFGALFNWGVSDAVLQRLKFLFERLPERSSIISDAGGSGSGGAGLYTTEALCKDAATLVAIMAPFSKESNVRQGVHAERCCAAVRIFADPTIAAAIESLNLTHAGTSRSSSSNSSSSDAKHVFSLFQSVNKLLLNNAVSSEIAQRVMASTCKVLCSNSAGDCIREVVIGDDKGNPKSVEDTRFLIECAALSGAAKQQLAGPLLEFVAARARESSAALKEEAIRLANDAAATSTTTATSSNSLSSLLSSELSSNNNKKKKKPQEEQAERELQTHRAWIMAMPSLAGALIRNGFVSPKKLPLDILHSTRDPSAEAQEAAEKLQAEMKQLKKEKKQLARQQRKDAAAAGASAADGDTAASSSSPSTDGLLLSGIGFDAMGFGGMGDGAGFGLGATDPFGNVPVSATAVGSITTTNAGLSSTTALSSSAALIAPANTDEALAWLEEFQKCDVASPELRAAAEPFARFIIRHIGDKEAVSAPMLVRAFCALDRLGYLAGAAVTEGEKGGATTASGAIKSLASATAKAAAAAASTDASAKATADATEVLESFASRLPELHSTRVRVEKPRFTPIAGKKHGRLFKYEVTPSAVPAKTRLRFIRAVAKSNSAILWPKTLEEKADVTSRFVDALTSMLQDMSESVGADQLSVARAVELGESAGWLCQKLRASCLSAPSIVNAGAGGGVFGDNSGEWKRVRVRNRSSIQSGDETTSSAAVGATEEAAAVAATSTLDDPFALFNQLQQQAAETIGGASVEKRKVLQQDLLVGIVRKVSVMALAHRNSLSPSQCIALLECLAVSGVAQNSIFASLLAVVDTARKNAPLLEADVLSLVAVVTYLTQLGRDGGGLSAAAAVDLDCARAAAQDALGQLMRYLVRSRSLDRVVEFGRLLDAVVTVLAASIDVHTMQALGASCMTRAQRGQLSADDVELILRVITNRLAVAPHLAANISRTVLPDLRRHVASKCFPTMAAPACCSALVHLHACSPLQHCHGSELDAIILSFETRMMQVGRQLDAPAISKLCVVYRDLQRTSPVLLHVLTHLTTLKPSTVTAQHVRDIATATQALRSPHPAAMAYLEQRAVHVVHEMNQSALCDTLRVFAPNGSQVLGAAVNKMLSSQDDFFVARFDAAQAASVAQSLVMMGVVQNVALLTRLLSVVYAERRASRVVSNSAVITQLLFVFDKVSRNVHPELFDLISPRRHAASNIVRSVTNSELAQVFKNPAKAA